MVTTPRHSSKPSGFILYALAFILTFLLCLPWVNAKETPKPKPQQWQIDGISAALDDGYDKVKRYALDQLVKYNLKDLKSLGKKPEDIARKAAKILKDEKVTANVRSAAAVALGNLGQAAANYVPDIAKILKDEKVPANVRSAAASGKIRKLELKEVIVILNNVYEPGSSEYLNWRFLTYFLSGGTVEVKTLLKWLGSPQVVPEKLTYDEGVKTLNLFLQVWNSSQGLERLRDDLARQISEVTTNKNVTWKL